MLLSTALDLPASVLVLVFVAAVGSYALVQILLDPLRNVPGPVLARFTRFWYFFEVYKGSFEVSNVELHKKYGPVVRIAPQEYSIDDVEAAKVIYGLGSGFVKVYSLLAECHNDFRVEHADNITGTMVLGVAATLPR